MNLIRIKYHYTMQNKIPKISFFTLADFCATICLLLQIYMYLYTASRMKQYSLLYNIGSIKKYLAKEIAFISIIPKHKNNGILKDFINISFIRNKFLIIKWLRYFLFKYICNKQNLRISLQHIKKLYRLYDFNMKKYKNIIDFPILPYVFLLYNNKEDKGIQNLLKLQRTVIYITPTSLSFNNLHYIKTLKTCRINKCFLNYISNIIITSLVHGSLF